MLKIYDYSRTIKGSYFIRKDSTVVLFDMKNRTIDKSRGLRIQLFFLYYSVTELRAGTKEYNKVLGAYEAMLADLPLPYRYEFRVLTPDSTANMEKELNRIDPKSHLKFT